MIKLYNRKALPTDARVRIKTLLDTVNKEEFIQKHDININFGEREAKRYGNLSTAADINTEISIGLKLLEDLFKETDSTSMVYNIYYSLSGDIQNIDRSLAYELGHVRGYAANFGNEISMRVEVEEDYNKFLAYKYITELLSHSYACSIMDKIDTKYNELEAKRIYQVFLSLLQTGRDKQEIIEFLIRLNGSLLGFIFDLAYIIAITDSCDKESRIFMDESYGNIFLELQNESISILKEAEHGKVEDRHIQNINNIMKSIQVIYE